MSERDTRAKLRRLCAALEQRAAQSNPLTVAGVVAPLVLGAGLAVTACSDEVETPGGGGQSSTTTSSTSSWGGWGTAYGVAGDYPWGGTGGTGNDGGWGLTGGAYGVGGWGGWGGEPGGGGAGGDGGTGG